MTVSRVLNRADLVSAETRDKIQQVIDVLHYQPSPMAQGLATHTTQIIGLMMYSDVEYYYLHQILLGVERAARMNGYDLLIFANPEEHNLRGNPRLGLVDGVLCFGHPIPNEALEKLELEGIPYAVIGRRNWRQVAPWHYAPDYIRGFGDVTRYLLNLGHQNIAMMGGSPHFEVDLEKYSGFQQALFEAGIPYNPAMTVYDDESFKIKGIIEKFRPTTVIAERNSLLALLLAARELGLRIPQDISVIGTGRELDVQTLHKLTGVHELTIVEVPWQELGAGGIQMLTELIRGEEPEQEQTIPLRFTIGESCAPPLYPQIVTGNNFALKKEVADERSK
ncbi:LacI family transcriptional regulator [Spirochaetia bacterium]|nr:LacI family transcriptional regulator [Spirochaetia bacterium]